MIILAKAVPYGGNAARYAMEKEDATVVKVNHMPDYLDATEIWYRMKHHCQLHQQDRTVGRKLERFMTTFVISPSKKESENFTMDDWANLADEGLEALDSVGLLPKGMKEKVKTNFRNSMSVAALHRDSKSGTLHLHLDCCRVDNDGKTNDVHDIHLRAMMAAEIINARHGWEQPQEVRDMRKLEIAEFCEYTLQKMDSFDVDRFFNMLRMKGYEVKPKHDNKNGKLVGYTIGKNASVFKASAIGRRFMMSQLEATWKKMHPKPTQVKMRPATPSVTLARPARPTAQTTKPTQPKVQPKVQPKPESQKTLFTINTGSEVKKVWIPNSLRDIFVNEAQVPEGNDVAVTENISHVAMLLFAVYVDAATSMSVSCGGGGSSPSSGWGKKDDEDDREYARRCLQMAHAMVKPPQKRRTFHR